MCFKMLISPANYVCTWDDYQPQLLDDAPLPNSYIRLTLPTAVSTSAAHEYGLGAFGLLRCSHIMMLPPLTQTTTTTISNHAQILREQ
jgi:hypothetical protein